MAILFTGGREEKWERWTDRIPKRDLIGVLVVRFQDKRPLIPVPVLGKEQLIEEQMNVGRKITGGAPRPGLPYPDAAPVSTSSSLAAIIAS